MATSVQIVIDCADPAHLAGFWATALGYVVQAPPAGFDSWESFLIEVGVPETEWNSASAVVDPTGKGPRIFFQRVPEPKSVKNRVHLDLNVGGEPGTLLDERKQRVDVEVKRLMTAGAKVVGPMEQRANTGWYSPTRKETSSACSEHLPRVQQTA